MQLSLREREGAVHITLPPQTYDHVVGIVGVTTPDADEALAFPFRFPFPRSPQQSASQTWRLSGLKVVSPQRTPLDSHQVVCSETRIELTHTRAPPSQDIKELQEYPATRARRTKGDRDAISHWFSVFYACPYLSRYLFGSWVAVAHDATEWASIG